MLFALQSNASNRPGYRADIDGLRAIAVLSVVLYHADIHGFSGGFVGVDVFFVISGYLIAGIIQRDLDRGRFSFTSFYERRIRRIFPALFAVVLVSAAVGAVLFPPQQYVEFGKSMLATTAFASNLYFNHVSVGAGYFEPSTGTQLLLHTWSLAVEEQFYLVFPIVLVVITRTARKGLGAILVLLAVLSFAFNVWLTAHNAIGAFYLPLNRAWELLIGSLLAVVPIPPARHIMVRTLLALSGLALIAYGVYQLSDYSLFPGYNALFPCIGTWLVIYAGQGPSPVKRLLGFPPLVFIGAISFSLYLWHWPVLAVARYMYVTRTLSTDQAKIPLVASFVLAWLSFQCIETPFRQRHAGTASRTVVRRGVMASVALAALALTVVVTNGVPRRFNPQKRTAMAENYERKAEFLGFGDCSNWHINPSQASDVRFCDVGHADKNILFWGDSHVSQLYPLLKEFQQSNLLHDEGIVFAVAGTCPPAEHFNVTYPGFHCGKFTTFALQRAMQPDIDTVFILFSPWWAIPPGTACASDIHDVCQRMLSGPESERLIVEELEGHIRTLQAAGKRVIVSMPFPIYNMLIPDYQIRTIALGRFNPVQPYPIDTSAFVDWKQLQSVAERNHAEIYAPRQTLCHGVACTFAIDGVSIYSDNSHLATSQLGILRDSLLKSLQPTN